jgi:MFS family permease
MHYGLVIVISSAFIAFLVGGFVFYGFTAFFEAIVAEMGFSYAKVSFAGSLRGLEMSILAPFAGYLVDRFGARKLAIFGVMVSGLGIMLLGFTRSLPTFYLAFLLLAFGAGGCSGIVLTTSVVNWFKDKQGLAIGAVSSGFALSGLLIPVIVHLIDKFGWRETLYIAGMAMWVIGIPLSILIKENPEAVSLRGNDQISGLRGFKPIMGEKSFFVLSLSEFLRYMIVSTVVIHIMPCLSSLGIERSRASFIASLVPVTSILGRFGFGLLADIFDRKYTMAVTGLFVMVSMLFLLEGAIFPFILFFSVGYGGGISVRGALLAKYFDARTYGKALGLLMALASVGGVIGPPLAGMIFDKMGSYKFVWLIYFFCAGLSTAAILILKKKHGAKENRISE